MKKIVIIINGSGGAGKDTVCDIVKKYHKVVNVSSIDPIKEIASQNGWNGEKTFKARKFLADLKKVFIEFNDLPTTYLVDKYNDFIHSDNDIMFAHIREGEEIDKLKNRIPTTCITLLIRRDVQGGEAYGNSADDDVENYNYDYYYNNCKTLEELDDDFMAFLNSVIEQL